MLLCHTIVYSIQTKLQIISLSVFSLLFLKENLRIYADNSQFYKHSAFKKSLIGLMTAKLACTKPGFNLQICIVF